MLQVITLSKHFCRLLHFCNFFCRLVNVIDFPCSHLKCTWQIHFLNRLYTLFLWVIISLSLLSATFFFVIGFFSGTRTSFNHQIITTAFLMFCVAWLKFKIIHALQQTWLILNSHHVLFLFRKIVILFVCFIVSFSSECFWSLPFFFSLIYWFFFVWS